jgi:ubiquinone/menaquinone biosynthesis C-methylase UbiE
MFSPRGGNMQQKFYDLILEHVEKNSTGKVLDIGTGNGILVIKAAMRYPAAQVTGVDMWGTDWEYSKSICAQNARIARVVERIEFKKGDAASLNYADETFDIVVSNLTFHEVKLVKHKSDVMRDALRLVKPGGSFAFIDYTSNNPVNATDIIGHKEIGMFLQSMVFLDVKDEPTG